MKIHPKGMGLLPPATDYITGESLVNYADDIVDTGVNIDIGRVDPRNGRVYLAASTVETLAATLGCYLAEKSDVAAPVADTSNTNG